MLAQTVFHTILATALTAPLALGFQLVLRTSRFFHFAHGVVFTIAPYVALATEGVLGIYVALAVGILTSIGTGLAIDQVCYRKLRASGSSHTVMLLASLGIYFFLQGLLSAVFGNEMISLRWWPVSEGRAVFGAYMTLPQLAIVPISILAVLALLITLRRSMLGRQMVAVGDDLELSEIVGIPVARVQRLSMVLASGLAGLAGILTALDVDMTPHMGLNPLMIAVTAVIVGGPTPAGALLGSFLVSLVAHFSVLVVSATWQTAVVFLVMIAFLLLRPAGILGRPGQWRT